MVDAISDIHEGVRLAGPLSVPFERMIVAALRAPKRVARAPRHVAAWLMWHSVRVSLLEDLEEPLPPHAAS